MFATLVSPEEWQVRVDLAAAYRLVADYGWDDLVFTHISARVPGPEHHFLINPYGMMFEEITASSLGEGGSRRQDRDGFGRTASIRLGSRFTAPVHAAREDALCVMHLHTEHGIAVSAQTDGLLPISQQSLFVLASLGYHDYEGLALNDEEKPRSLRTLEEDFSDSAKSRFVDVGPTVRTRFSRCFCCSARAGFRSWRSQVAETGADSIEDLRADSRAGSGGYAGGGGSSCGRALAKAGSNGRELQKIKPRITR
jgi:ribulose-5-phosphate 4-epimerase/fuculose-1-phosphate aldolase